MNVAKLLRRILLNRCRSLQVLGASFLLLNVAIGFSRTAYAHEDPLPPVNQRTIVGVWEAVSENDPRVFRMQLLPNGKGLLAVAIPSREPILLRLENESITDGQCKLLFQEIAGKYQIRVDVRGVADQDVGVISGEVVMGLVGPPDSSWSVRFIKEAPESYLEEMYRLSQKAKKAIAEARTEK